jgi:hypothetical protein
MVPSAGLEPTLPPSSRTCLLPLGQLGMEPLDGLEPPSSPYERDTLPVELQRRELPILASNQEPPEPESGALPFLS